ncbi:hypothetical protein ACOJUR_11800 [Alicyclobacillus tolerans]|uniref:hypothetical protein n=1 Tax=Alicyclobacillus TaxID=29330 RepID=UPI001932574D|nr:hypothetical protein [Alicyclobacillus sp. TC]QRF23042.1 hypothetical protein FY534_04625 [Alicyclobacillus sp. TC]
MRKFPRWRVFYLVVLICFGIFSALGDGLNLWNPSVFGGGTGVSAAPSYPTAAGAKHNQFYENSLTPSEWIQLVHLKKAQQLGNFGKGETIALFETNGYFSMPSYLSFCKSFASTDPSLLYPNQIDVWTDGKLLHLNRSSQIIRPNAETLLDTEWAHVVAPKARLLIVDIHQSGIQHPLTLSTMQSLFKKLHVTVVSSSIEQGLQPLMTHNPLLQERTFGSRQVLQWIASHYPFFQASGDQPGHVSETVFAPQMVIVGASQFVHHTWQVAPWEGAGPAVWTAFASSLQREAAKQPFLYRQTPDVVWFGGNPGVILSDSRGFLGGVEGTSLATPTFAALFALADAAHVENTGRHLPKNANALLYHLALQDPHAFSSISVKNTAFKDARWRPGQGLGNPNPDTFVLDLSKWNDSTFSQRSPLHLSLWPFYLGLAAMLLLFAYWIRLVVSGSLALDRLSHLYPQVQRKLALYFLSGSAILPLLLFAERYILLITSLQLSGSQFQRIILFSIILFIVTSLISFLFLQWYKVYRTILMASESIAQKGEQKR